MENSKVVEKIIESVKEERNVFLHGPGGVGKTVVLVKVAQQLRECGIKTYCTATTGIAAVNLSSDGLMITQTLHSWAGIGLAEGSIDALLSKIKTNRNALKRWKSVTVLIIDETSMLGSSLFDKIEELARRVRENDLTFGGIILIMAADFMQLSPVKDGWLFENKKFKDLNFRYFVLTKPKRYSDPQYFEFLLRLRKGKHTEDDLKVLRARTVSYENMLKSIKDPTRCIIPTTLFSRRDSTDDYNNKRLNELSGDEFVFEAKDECIVKKGVTLDCEKKLKACKELLDQLLPKFLRIKVGAQVMLKVNLDVDSCLVNGSRGVVTHVSENGISVTFFKNRTIVCSTPTVRKLEDKQCVITRSQMPFILAWGLTIHSCQGTTLDTAIEDMGPSVFADGQAYVSLSRVRELKGLFLSDFHEKSIKVDKKALEFVENIENNAFFKEE